ncbi:MAG: hypothetical protein HOH88_03345 [Flavobacteriales bacterium]|jgi:hypothetical protein|nr:hypothetical protein [Flavobacteriales bacterium]
MKKILVVLLFIPLALSSQEYVEYNLIGWTIDNKVISQQYAEWMEGSQERIIVQDLITDKIEDYLTITYSTEFWSEDFGSGCVIFNKSLSIRDTLYPDYKIDSMKHIMYVEKFLNKYNINKQSILLDGINYIEEYDLNIELRINIDSSYYLEMPEDYDEYIDVRYSKEFDLLVGNKIIGYKSIGSGSAEADEVEIRLDGYFMSPLDSRVLVVVNVRTIENGEDYFEGQYFEEWNYFFGCSLNPSTFK